MSLLTSAICIFSRDKHVMLRSLWQVSRRECERRLGCGCHDFQHSTVPLRSAGGVCQNNATPAIIWKRKGLRKPPGNRIARQWRSSLGRPWKLWMINQCGAGARAEQGRGWKKASRPAGGFFCERS